MRSPLVAWKFFVEDSSANIPVIQRQSAVSYSFTQYLVASEQSVTLDGLARSRGAGNPSSVVKEGGVERSRIGFRGESDG